MKTWEPFVVLAVLCVLFIVWGNRMERTRKTEILTTGAMYIGLAALMLAVCSTGNYFLILVAMALVSFIIVGRSRQRHEVNKLMLAGAVIGLIITHSVFHLAEAVHHEGPGFVDDRGAGDDYSGPPDIQKLSESEYKRHEYSLWGGLLVMGVLAWIYVGGYGKDVVLPEAKGTTDNADNTDNKRTKDAK